jgi:hypothetical protein
MKKMNLLVLLLIAVGLGHALVKVIDIGFAIDRNDTVTMTDLEVAQGEPQRFFGSESGPYELQINDADGLVLSNRSFDMDFWLLSDPPKLMNMSANSFRLEYPSNSKILTIRHGNRTILLMDLPDETPCNNDRLCDAGENAFGCPADCGPDATDGYCTALNDGVCDPDCTKGEDQDCIPKIKTIIETTETENPVEAPPPASSCCMFPSMVFAVLLAMAWTGKKG